MKWLYFLLAICAYAGLGFWFSGNGAAEEWLYRIGLLIATFIPLLFAAVYAGFRYHDPVGTALVHAVLTLIPIVLPLAYIFWFDNGNLTQSWLAWVEVSGPILSVIFWVRLFSIWFYHASKQDKKDDDV